LGNNEKANALFPQHGKVLRVIRVVRITMKIEGKGVKK
jgi:hypothetical protein